MFRLVWKDIIAGRWFWLLVLAVYLVHATLPLMGSLVFMAAAAALVAGWLAVTLILEDRNKTEILYASLPLKRSSIVSAKYVLAVLLTLAGGTFVILYGRLASSLKAFKFMNFEFSGLLTAEGIAGYAGFVLVLCAIYFPFYFRFGLGRGSGTFIALLLALSIFLLGLGRLGVAGRGLRRLLLSAEFLKDPGTGIVGALGRIRAGLGLPLFLFLSLAFLAIVLWASARLSIGAYSRREF